MSDPVRVLVVAHRTATSEALQHAVRERAARGPVTFHLVVPAEAHGFHRLVDPQDDDKGDAEQALEEALPLLSAAAASEVTGELGDSEPLSAIQDAVNVRGADEILISTLPSRVSRWLRVDLVSKARGLGLPVTHVESPVRVPAG